MLYWCVAVINDFESFKNILLKLYLIRDGVPRCQCKRIWNSVREMSGNLFPLDRGNPDGLPADRQTDIIHNVTKKRVLCYCTEEANSRQF